MSSTKSRNLPAVCERIKAFLVQRKLTQQKAAKNAGISQQTVGKWIAGTPPNIVNLSNFAQANGVPVSFFLEINPASESSRQPGKLITMDDHLVGQEYKEGLDNPSTPGDAGDVLKITTLPELIAALRKLTIEHGLKSDLAKHCQVTRQAVDQWLSKKANPSADAVFAALDWVQKHRKAKN